MLETHIFFQSLFQGFIDEPDKNWTRAELPPISDPFSVEDVKKRVLQLNKVRLQLLLCM